MLHVGDLDLHRPDGLDDGPGGDAVLLVVLHLEVPAAVDLFHSPVDRAGHHVGVEDDVGVDVPGGPADDLDEGALVPEEPLLVGVQDADEPHLGDVQALPEEVDPHEDVELPEPELPDDLGPLDGLDLRVEVPALDPPLGEVVGELLGEALCQRHNPAAVAPGDGLLALPDDVRGLAFDGPGGDHRFQEAGGPDDLLRDPLRFVSLVGARGRRDEDHVPHVALELLEPEGAVVVGRGEPEAVVHEGLLPGAVAVVHPVELGDGLVALVDKEEGVPGEVVEQAVGLLPGRPEVEVPGVVLVFSR